MSQPVFSRVATSSAAGKFPFSQVTLAHMARELQTRHQVAVEVIAIDVAPTAMHAR